MEINEAINAVTEALKRRSEPALLSLNARRHSSTLSGPKFVEFVAAFCCDDRVLECEVMVSDLVFESTNWADFVAHELHLMALKKL